MLPASSSWSLPGALAALALLAAACGPALTPPTVKGPPPEYLEPAAPDAGSPPASPAPSVAAPPAPGFVEPATPAAATSTDAGPG